jgi:chemotaxis family two-component system response regulator Rcp1
MTSSTEVLLVNDGHSDTNLITEVLRGKYGLTRVHSVASGVEAMAFLHHEGKYASDSSPHLIVLDVNDVQANGKMVLECVKSDPSLRQIPVIVFSESTAQSAIAESYRLGANSYVTRPSDRDEFVSTVTAMREFWLGLTKYYPDGMR